VVVVLGPQGNHQHHAVKVFNFDAAAASADVHVGGRHYAIQSPTKLGDILMTGRCNGQPFCAQVERGSAKQPLSMRIAHNGTQIDTLVLLPRAAELLRLMPYKALPGLLVDVAVQPGQKVLAGEKLAVIEAMKMENILVAVQDGVVGEVLAKKGESLTVDQPIIAFS
jgi:propionyl-CoA carboxylase alpha chain